MRIRIAYAPALRSRASFALDLRCIVKRANALLEPTLGRRLEVVDKVGWIGGGSWDSARKLRSDLMHSVPTGDADIVVGLAGYAGGAGSAAEYDDAVARPVRIATDQGLSAYTQGYVLISVEGRSMCGAYRLLAHEIGHLFGGVHRESRRWLMDPAARGYEVDPLNRELFALHRDRRFGAAPLDGSELRAMWRLSGAELDDPGTWLIVGNLAARMGKPAAATMLYQRAIDIDPQYALARVNMGHAYFMLGDYAMAEACYLRALRGTPTDGLVHNNLAAIYLGAGDLNRATAHLRAALSLQFEVDPRFIGELERLTGQRIIRH